MKDEIIEELWRVKDQITAETKGNTQALFDRLRTIRFRFLLTLLPVDQRAGGGDGAAGADNGKESTAGVCPLETPDFTST